MTAENTTATLHTDGASLGNPGPAGAGFVLTGPGGKLIAEQAVPLGVATNNVAEYRALIAGLNEALNLGITRIRVLSDSELMCKQLTGIYRVKNEGIKPLFAWAQQLAGRFEHFAIAHCPREHNAHADELAGEAAKLSRQQLDNARCRRAVRESQQP